MSFVFKTRFYVLEPLTFDYKIESKNDKYVINGWYTVVVHSQVSVSNYNGFQRHFTGGLRIDIRYYRRR